MAWAVINILTFSRLADIFHLQSWSTSYKLNFFIPVFLPQVLSDIDIMLMHWMMRTSWPLNLCLYKVMTSALLSFFAIHVMKTCSISVTWNGFQFHTQEMGLYHNALRKLVFGSAFLPKMLLWWFSWKIIL